MYIWIIPTVYEPCTRCHRIAWWGGWATVINRKRFTEIILHTCMSTYSKIYKYNYHAGVSLRQICLSSLTCRFIFFLQSFITSLFPYSQPKIPKIIENFCYCHYRSSQSAFHTIQASSIYILIHGSSHGNRGLQSQMPLCFFSATQKLKGRIYTTFFFNIPLRECG